MPSLMIWLLLISALIGLVVLDLRMARRYYRDKGGSHSDRGAFFRWWREKNVWKLRGALLIGCVLLAGLGNCLVREGRHFMASRDHRLRLKADTAGYMANARRYAGEKKYREAALELQNAIRQDRNDAEAHLLLARASGKLGNLAGARDAYRETLRIEPKRYEAHLELGQVHLELTETAEALQQAEQARTLNPRAPEPRLLQARIHAAAGETTRAADQLRAVLAADPADRKSRNLLVDMLLESHACAEAGQIAEAGLLGEPGNTVLRVKLALARKGEGRQAEALAILRKAAAEDVTASLPLMKQGDLQYEAGEYLAALQSYEEALSRSPELKLAMNNIAALQSEHGYDLTRAAELASRLYSRYPRDPTVMDTMGWVLCRQGKPGQALPLLRQAVARAPRAPEYRYHYGATLIRMGRTAEGRKELEEALKLSGTFNGAAKARLLLAAR